MGKKAKGSKVAQGNPFLKEGKGNKRNPGSLRTKEGREGNPSWNNRLNIFSQKGADMRADSSGTSSVGRNRRMKEEQIVRDQAAAKQRGIDDAAFKAQYPNGIQRPAPGARAPGYQYGGSRGYRPELGFGAALAPRRY